MSKHTPDYTDLKNVVYKKIHRLADVKNQIVKVSWDIVRFKDSDKGADLWQVQSSDDGDYIVKLYSDADDDHVKTASKNPWEVMFTKNASHLNIFYKGEPLAKIAADRLGVPASELEQVAGYLPARLESNKKLVAAMLSEVSESTKNEILRKYPELV
jgi:hypothetical protein